MWTLQFGQIVELAAEFSSCRWPQSKQTTEVIRGRYQTCCKRRRSDWDATTPPSSRFALAATGVGEATRKCRPHCRQSVLLAAAYSFCLKPQCGHSTPTLTGVLATNLSRGYDLR